MEFLSKLLTFRVRQGSQHDTRRRVALHCLYGMPKLTKLLKLPIASQVGLDYS